MHRWLKAGVARFISSKFNRLIKELVYCSGSCVEIRLQVEFHPPGLPRSGRFMVGDKKKRQQKKQNKKFHEINGFLSLQLGLSFELGFRLRLTNIRFLNN